MTSDRSQSMTSRRSTQASGPGPEEGSAYLAVLMLLVVLTILGLSLSVVTQTEVIIGGNEKQSTRQLYQAESAAQLAIVAKLVDGNTTKKMMILARRDQAMFGGTTSIGDRVCTSQLYPDHVGPSELSTINIGKIDQVSAQFGVTARALRHGGDELAARRELGSLVSLDPVQVTAQDLIPLDEEERDLPSGLISASSDPRDLIDPCFEIRLRF